MMQEEPLIRLVFLFNPQKKPLKVQFFVNFRVEKLMTDEFEKKMEIYFKAEITTVFAEGLSNQDYFEILDRMFPLCFPSHHMEVDGL